MFSMLYACGGLSEPLELYFNFSAILCRRLNDWLQILVGLAGKVLFDPNFLFWLSATAASVLQYNQANQKRHLRQVGHHGSFPTPLGATIWVIY